MIISVDIEAALEKNPAPILYKNSYQSKNRKEFPQSDTRHL